MVLILWELVLFQVVGVEFRGKNMHSLQRVFIPPPFSNNTTFFDPPPPTLKKSLIPLPNIILPNPERSYADCFG